jgi:hypothetical protein
VSLALYLNESLSVKHVYEANKRSLQVFTFSGPVSGRSHTEVLLKAKDLLELDQLGRTRMSNYYVLPKVTTVPASKVKGR